jgi:hypothetical protein
VKGSHGAGGNRRKEITKKNSERFQEEPNILSVLLMNSDIFFKTTFREK